MTASAAEVEAAQKVVREHRPRESRRKDDNPEMWEFPCSCGEVLRNGGEARDLHLAQAVADAVVAAAQPRIAAETLREAAAEAFQIACAGATMHRDLEPGEGEWFWAHELGKDDAFDHPSRAATRWLNARARQIEAQS